MTIEDALVLDRLDQNLTGSNTVDNGEPSQSIGLQVGDEMLVKRIVGDLGVSDDPIDETVEHYLHMADPQNLPDNEALHQQENIWSFHESWNSYSGIGVRQTMQHFNEEINERVFGTIESRGEQLLYLLVGGTTSTVSAVAKVEVEITFTQTNYRDDPMEWDGYEFEESQDDELESDAEACESFSG